MTRLLKCRRQVWRNGRRVRCRKRLRRVTAYKGRDLSFCPVHGFNVREDS